MQKVLIAFDVDGTLIKDGYFEQGAPEPNDRILALLRILARMKNTKIMVWSGGGEDYARTVVELLGIKSLVDCYADKQVIGCTTAECLAPDKTHWHFGYDGPQPDIAVDDIQSFSLGKFNLIVREK